MKASTFLAPLAKRSEMAVLGVGLLATLLFPAMAPGVYGLGVVNGANLVLPALAVVLIYRSERIINFAQPAVASVCAALFTVFVVRNEEGLGFHPLARLVNSACKPCLEAGPDGLFRLGAFAYATNYLVSMALIMGFAVALSLTCALIVQRLREAPRLVVTIATIFAGQAVVGVSGYLGRFLVSADQRASGLRSGPVPPPWGWQADIGGVTFGPAAAVTVVVAGLTVAALSAYVLRSRTGIAIRASASSPGRAATLGINVNKVGRRVWLLAGLLAGVTGIVVAMQDGIPSDTAATVLVRILFVAVVARLTSLPMAGLAGLAVGIVEQAASFSFGSAVLLDASLFVAIAVVLLLQRRYQSRADVEQASGWRADREIRPIPVVLRDLPVVRKWIRVGAVIGAIVLLGLPWIFAAQQTNLASIALIYGIVGISLLVLTGWAGQISLGQFGFAAFGAYAAAMTNLPFPLSLIAAAAGGAIAAVVIGIPAMRLRGLQLAVVTLAFAVAANTVLLSPRYLGKSLPTQFPRPVFLGVDLDDQRTFYYVTLVLLGLVAVAVVGMRRSRTARALIAARDNEQAAQSFGIGLVGARIAAFASSGAIAAIGGALYAYSQQSLNPDLFSAQLSIDLFLWVVVGGFGSVAGPLIGIGFFRLLPQILGTNPFTAVVFGPLGSGVIGLSLLMFFGGGLSQLVFRVRDNMLRRVAHRYGIVVPSLVADSRIDGDDPRVPIAPPVRSSGGGTVFVPSRYALDDQWAVDEGEDAVAATATRGGALRG